MTVHKVLDMEFNKKTQIIDMVNRSLEKYLSMGIKNLVIEIYVAEMECRTVKVSINPLEKKERVTEEEICEIKEHVESVLWRTLNMHHSWFVIVITIKNGNIVTDQVDVRFTDHFQERKKSEGKSTVK